MDIEELPIILKMPFVLVGNLVLLPLALLLVIIRVLLKIQFISIDNRRLGHLALKTELFLRRIKLGIIASKNIRYIGIASSNSCNNQLLEMYGRLIKIIKIPPLIYNSVLFEGEF